MFATSYDAIQLKNCGFKLSFDDVASTIHQSLCLGGAQPADDLPARGHARAAGVRVRDGGHRPGGGVIWNKHSMHD